MDAYPGARAQGGGDRKFIAEAPTSIPVGMSSVIGVERGFRTSQIWNVTARGRRLCRSENSNLAIVEVAPFPLPLVLLSSLRVVGHDWKRRCELGGDGPDCVYSLRCRVLFAKDEDLVVFFVFLEVL